MYAFGLIKIPLLSIWELRMSEKINRDAKSAAVVVVICGYAEGSS